VRLELPLFPGYMFVRLALAARLRVLEVPGVVRLIGFNGQPVPLPESEIETLRRGVLSASRVEPHPYMTVGSRVRIVRGPLQGVEGILSRKKNLYRVIVTINVIARAAAVEVDALDIQRIS
jgi:transcription antitermination factor NusG